jgi:dolichol-phosphate mannosyltransferase
VVVPTYNERENIDALIAALQGIGERVDILVVDDNSPDGTASLVQQLMQSRGGIYLMLRPGKGGIGSAYKEAFTFALGQSWRYICQMDADFSHSPEDVLQLLESCRKGVDVTIGSRYILGGKVVGWSLWRRLLSRTANFTAQVLLRSELSDLTSGFKCFKREALEQINLGRITSESYIFQVEMNHRARQKEMRIEQLPICFTERRQGKSKLSIKDAWFGIWQLLRLVLRFKKQNDDLS